jgi:hypothetical protein
LLTDSPLAAQTQGLPSSREEAVRAFFQDRFRDYRTAYLDTRYAVAWVDLNGDGRDEAVVRIMSRGFCGSGGCMLYILSPRGRGWSMVGRTTITHPPIRVTNSRSHGWRDISVFVAGGGIIPGYHALLPFDGRIYPFNPSMAPARRLGTQVSGRILISQEDRGQPLF